MGVKTGLALLLGGDEASPNAEIGAATAVFELSTDERREMAPADALSYASLSELVAARVNARRQALGNGAADTRAGRLGPANVECSCVAGQADLSMGSSSLSASSTSSFSSVRANACVYTGKWQYEATVCTAGIMQVRQGRGKRKRRNGGCGGAVGYLGVTPSAEILTELTVSPIHRLTDASSTLGGQGVAQASGARGRSGRADV